MQTFYNKIAELNEIGAKGGEEVKLAAARYYMVEAKEMLKQAKAAPAGHSDVPAAGQPAPVSAGNNEKESASDGV